MTEMPQDMHEYNRRLIAEFRANGAPEGRPLLLLTTTGARSGELRTTPLMYVRYDDRLLIIAANAGAPRNPDWVYNLVAEPIVRVELADQDFSARATVLSGVDRDGLFKQICADNPFIAEYQNQVTRAFPVVELTPLGNN